MAGEGKNFLPKIITEYVKRNLMYNDKELQQTILVTASAGKAVSHISGLTLHLTFYLQIMEEIVVMQSFPNLVKKYY